MNLPIIENKVKNAMLQLNYLNKYIDLATYLKTGWNFDLVPGIYIKDQRQYLRIRTHINNPEVLRWMNMKASEILRNIKLYNHSILGHIMKNEKYDILQLIFQGKV